MCDTAAVDCSACNSGYTISAEAASGSAQTCNANTCTATQVINSDQSGSGIITGTTGSSTTVTCNTGYAGTATFLATCGNDGKFNPITCAAEACTATQVTNSDKAETGSIAGTTGHTVTVTCSSGYSVSGTATATATATCSSGTSRTFTTVTCTANTCTAGSVVNSNYEGSESITGTTGQTREVKCNDGYSGGGTATCRTSGTFDIDTLTCAAKTCTCENGTPTIATGSGATLCNGAGEDCSACNAGFILSATPGVGSQTCVSCIGGSTYKLLSNTATSCTGCSPSCSAGEKKVACTTTADRICQSCDAGSNWQDQTAHSDPSCKTCSTTCGSGTKFAACTKIADRQCDNCDQDTFCCIVIRPCTSSRFLVDIKVASRFWIHD